MSKIKTLAAKNNSEAWSMYHSFNHGCAVLLHDMDVDGEWVTAQYTVDGGELCGQESTPVRRYKVYTGGKDHHGEPRTFIRMYGWRVYLDEFMWRGGSIAEAQRILVDNGTIKA